MHVLVYRCKPLDLHAAPRYYLMEPRKVTREVGADEALGSRRTVISHSVPELFCHLRDTQDVTSEVVDVCLAARLLLGRKSPSREGYRPWDTRMLLRSATSDAGLLRRIAHVTTDTSDDVDDDAQTVMHRFALLVRESWLTLSAGLRQRGEMVRFVKVEHPVQQVLLERQRRGIRISGRRLRTRLDVTSLQIADSSRRLRKEWGVLDPDDQSEIDDVLSKHGMRGVRPRGATFVDDSLIDCYAQGNSLAATVKNYRDSKADRTRLLRLGALGQGRVHPVFATMGTVTGRIMVESPPLQFIKKSNRGIIVPDSGRVLLYPDFAQFEPGILADDSKDRALIDDYNNGDLYAALGRQLYGSDARRESAKILFLSYCYGMGSRALARHVAATSGMSIALSELRLADFFGRYAQLTRWRKSLNRRLAETGRIGTRQGNFRYRASHGPLLASESRWVMSQRIQGTASLILKRIVLRVAREFPSVDVLLPMHDALLLQVPKAERKRLSRALVRVFEDEFAGECPSVRPRVVLKPFAVAGD